MAEFLRTHYCARGLEFMSKTLVIILLGPPGAGKGSQASLLKEELGKRSIRLGHISTGDLLRDHIKRKTPLGEKAKSFMDDGQLVPDALILDMLFERVCEPDCKEGYILDGFPRTLAQAEAFQERLGPHSTVHAIDLSLPDEEILNRLTKRVICSQCQRPYHLLYSPPKTPGICDFCGGTLYQRSDDNEEVVKKRLEVYHSQTKPLIAYYHELGLLHSIDAKGKKEEILNQLLSLVSIENSN